MPRLRPAFGLLLILAVPAAPWAEPGVPPPLPVSRAAGPVAVKCDDPVPGKIRAPYADRDNVAGTDDNVAVFLDTRSD